MIGFLENTSQVNIADICLATLQLPSLGIVTVIQYKLPCILDCPPLHLIK